MRLYFCGKIRFTILINAKEILASATADCYNGISRKVEIEEDKNHQFTILFDPAIDEKRIVRENL